MEHIVEAATRGMNSVKLNSMCSVKQAVLKNFAIFKGKHLCWSLLKQLET